MRVATWNVNGIRARHEQVLEWVGREAPDVICLQELKARRDQVPESIACLSGYWCHWHGEGAYSGVALHLRQDTFGAEPRHVHPPFDVETRVVTAEAAGTVFASVYVPNGGKDHPAKIRFLEAMVAWTRQVHDSGRLLVVCGDLNVARTDADVHPKERRAVTGQLPEERDLFERLLGEGLVDVGRALHPEDDDMFTWWAPWRQMRERNIGWRLDYVLASSPLASRATACVVQREVGTSDHGPVIATFGR